MQNENQISRHAGEIAAEVWRKMGDTNLADPMRLGNVPDVRFKHLDNNLNGLAWPDHIELNIDRLEESDVESFLQEIIRHELAHVAEYRLTGIMGHGPLWHALCLAVGGKRMEEILSPIRFPEPDRDFLWPLRFWNPLFSSAGGSARSMHLCGVL